MLPPQVCFTITPARSFYIFQIRQEVYLLGPYIVLHQGSGLRKGEQNVPCDQNPPKKGLALANKQIPSRQGEISAPRLNIVVGDHWDRLPLGCNIFTDIDYSNALF